jgi:hypothetical protein
MHTSFVPVISGEWLGLIRGSDFQYNNWTWVYRPCPGFDLWKPNIEWYENENKIMFGLCFIQQRLATYLIGGEK